MADFTTTTEATWIPKLWADEIQSALQSKIVVVDLVKHVKFGEGKSKGDVLHIPKLSNLVAEDIIDNADIDGQAPTEGEITITLNQKKHSSVYIQKHLQNNLSKYDFRKEYTTKIGYALAQAMQVYLLTLLDTNSGQTVGSTGASATDITDDMIRGAMEFLDTANVDMNDRSIVMYPDQRSAMLNIGKFVEKQTAGQDTTSIVSGKVLDVYGMNVEFTTDVVQAGTTPNFYRIGQIFQKEVAAFGSPDMGPDVEYNYVPRRKAWLLSGDVLYGASIYRTLAGVLAYTDN